MLGRVFKRSFSTPLKARVSTSEPLHYPKASASVLTNGLRVVSEKHAGETVTVSVHVDSGSRHEPLRLNGVAHFCEHMFFKGTERRSRSALEKEVENIGGELNASTSRDHTMFTYTVFKKDAAAAFDLLSDMIMNSKFDPAAIDVERSTILAEMEHVHQDNYEVLFDRLHETAYRGVALGRTILGPTSNIQSFTQNDLLSYVKNQYIAPRMVVSVSGDIDHQTVHDLTSKHFGSLRSRPDEKFAALAPEFAHPDPASFLGSDIRVRFDSMPEAHVAVGFPTAGHTDADHIPLMVFQQMLGAYTEFTSSAVHSSSPLLSEVAKANLVKSYQPFNVVYKDTGLFGINFVGDMHSLEEMMYLITREFTSAANGVDESRVNEAKVALAYQWLAQSDNIASISEDMGRQVLNYGRRIHPAEVLARISTVDKNAVRAVADRFFYDRDHALAAIGPIWGLPDYLYTRRRAYQLLPRV